MGTIGIVDADEVDLSNLQRQVIHTTADVGKLKVESAAETMKAINPDVTVNTYHTFVDSSNIMDLIKITIHSGWNRQLPCKIPYQRCLCNGRETFFTCRYHPFPGTADDLRPGTGTMLQTVHSTSPPPKDAVPTVSRLA